MDHEQHEQAAQAKYTTLEQKEHILKRPDTYIGSINCNDEELWTIDDLKQFPRHVKLSFKSIKISKGCYKIYDEIQVNAMDACVETWEKIRKFQEQHADIEPLKRPKCPFKSTKRIDIDFDQLTGRISISNDGDGIPVVRHSKYNDQWIPEMIFGTLLSSGNYNDDQKRITGGLNGIGAKATNIFSTEFTVETVDHNTKRKFIQVWKNNMETPVNPPQILENYKKPNQTKISFIPDFKRFDMPGLTDEFAALICKRAVDLAGTLGGVHVYVNQQLIQVKNFKQYIQLYLDSISINESSLPSSSLESSKTNTPAPSPKSTTSSSSLLQSQSSSQTIQKTLDKYSKSASTSVSVPVSEPSVQTRQLQLIYEEINDRWQVGITSSPDSQFRQVSFVNGICTSNGGRHVDYVANQIAREVARILGADINVMHVKNNMWIFVNCKIENPHFTSQTKEELATASKDFGSTCEFSDTFLKKIAKSEIGKLAKAYKTFRDETVLKRSDGKKQTTVNIPKLEDANFAGTRHSQDCTLILTEGDSARSSVESAMGVLGRQYYGVFPLRGKLLNVRDHAFDSIAKNQELAALKKILGLQQERIYTSLNELRYGAIMILTDADEDGNHIKGLIMNYIGFFWKELLTLGFVTSQYTPVYRVFDKSKQQQGSSSKAILNFFSESEYIHWKATHSTQGLIVKNYKGLGSSTKEEFIEYMTKMPRVNYMYDEKASEHLELAFSKKKADQRKEWIARPLQALTFSEIFNKTQQQQQEQAEETIKTVITKTTKKPRKNASKKKQQELIEKELPTNIPMHSLRGRSDSISSNNVDQPSRQSINIPISDFINQELILFSIADNVRSIPSFVDGFKVSQRKIMHYMLNYGHVESKVSNLAGFISGETCYHHGEVSLSDAIIKMAQNFVGSNNINLLSPIGQFGTRLEGGSDNAKSRYISSKIEPIAEVIFPKSDILQYEEVDGHYVEPRYLLPILPMILVNGNSGIGTGYSTFIPCYNPKQLAEMTLEWLNYLEQPKSSNEFKFSQQLIPWYRGFTGRIDFDPVKKRWFSEGVFQRHSALSILIIELPVGVWTNQFIENLKSASQKELKSSVPTAKSTRKKRTVTKSPKSTKPAVKRQKRLKDFINTTATTTTTTTETNNDDNDNNDDNEKKDDNNNLDESSKKPSLTVASVQKATGDDDVVIRIQVKFDQELKNYTNDEIVQALKLRETKSFQTGNMHMFDPLGNIVKFGTAEQILLAFLEFRILFYEKQRQFTLKQMELDCLVLQERVRFIREVTNKTLNIYDSIDLPELLMSRGYLSNPETNLKHRIDPRDYHVTDKEIAQVFMRHVSRPELYEKFLQPLPIPPIPTFSRVISKDDDKKNPIVEVDFQYLLGMSIQSLTLEKKKQLEKELDKKHEEIKKWRQETSITLWTRDIKELLKKIIPV